MGILLAFVGFIAFAHELGLRSIDMLMRILTRRVAHEHLGDWKRYTKENGIPGMLTQPGCRTSRRAGGEPNQAKQHRGSVPFQGEQCHPRAECERRGINIFASP